MKLNLRPGEYVVWKHHGQHRGEEFWGLIIAGIFLLPLYGLGLILIIIALVWYLYGSGYAVTNMRAVVLGRRGVKGEVALNTPGLRVDLDSIHNQWRWEEEGHWESGQYVVDRRYRVPDNSPTGYSNLYFVVNGVNQLSFELPDQTAQELVTMLASMGIKVVEDLS